MQMQPWALLILLSRSCQCHGHGWGFTWAAMASGHPFASSQTGCPECDEIKGPHLSNMLNLQERQHPLLTEWDAYLHDKTRVRCTAS